MDGSILFPQDVEMVDSRGGVSNASICVYGCHSDDIVFVSLWSLQCNYLLMRLVFPCTRINIMFTGDEIDDSTRCAIEILHEATLGDLIKNKNSAIWHLLMERNQALHERYVLFNSPSIYTAPDCIQKQIC